MVSRSQKKERKKPQEHGKKLSESLQKLEVDGSCSENVQARTRVCQHGQSSSAPVGRHDNCEVHSKPHGPQGGADLHSSQPDTNLCCKTMDMVLVARDVKTVYFSEPVTGLPKPVFYRLPKGPL